MVVLVNYLHVMTILPSSILVNELYVADLQDAFVAWCKSKCCRTRANLELGEDYSTTVDAEKCSLDDEDGNNVASQAIVAKPSELNRTDRYLVEKYAPFVTRRPYYMLGAAVLLVRTRKSYCFSICLDGYPLIFKHFFSISIVGYRPWHFWCLHVRSE